MFFINNNNNNNNNNNIFNIIYSFPLKMGITNSFLFKFNYFVICN